MLRFLPLIALMAVPAMAAAPAPLPAASGEAHDSIEAPELGRLGSYSVGTDERELVLSARPHLAPGKVENVARTLGLRFWYPAQPGKGERTLYRHVMTLPDGRRTEIVERGFARSSAAPAAGKFPLVLISHGFGGWAEHLSRLGEQLASRGYVVVAVSHHDMPFTDVPGFLLSFANVLTDRVLDQRAVIAQLTAPDAAKTYPVLGHADLQTVGLIGYSMGGYGALATAGADYDPAGKPFAQVPPALVASTRSSAPSAVKALITIAPWGGQPDNRAWTAAGLAGIKAPVLMIDGDRDNVVNYREGVRWLFDNLSATRRYLLTYREARHNVAGNDTVLSKEAGPEAVGFLREPVWRLDRINQINQHFITAFLDLTLKGDSGKAAYLNVPTPLADDGRWPVPFGTLNKGAYAGAAQTEYWRGFQLGAAAGLELTSKTAGQ